MSPRTKQQLNELRDERRKLIMDTALELFSSNGYHATSIAQIATNAKIAKGSLYHYFESKEVLLAEIFTILYDELMLDFINNSNGTMKQKEAWLFIDKVFDHMTSNLLRWKMFMQLSVQPGIVEILMNISRDKKYTDYLESFYFYFANSESKDPQTTMILFSSVMKGFSFMYLFAPEMFSTEQIDSVKDFIKKNFLKYKNIKSHEKDISLGDNERYILL
ncbi:MAG: hypothetical protein CVU11_03730 [Bacteroidetes bacterium HGW-Bacteroidetes-6]|jgi:AcrR family transcriptional regulator|nr:MAG: hypothetical protein CVU11_03730 [Bacteroidetes bacterium HGW-Bacteroidetes-6]